MDDKNEKITATDIFSRPRIAPRARHISTFSWGEHPQTPRKERLLPINAHTIKFQTPDLQILYTPML